MKSCPICGTSRGKKSGIVKKTVMRKQGKKVIQQQAYRCENGHSFKIGEHGVFDDSFIETVVYLYLRCLSFNTTVDIIRMFYEEDILSKGQVVDFLELVADKLPTIDEIDAIYEPKRSGYIAVDGVWFQYGDAAIVLLVAFDPVSFDIIAALWTYQENYEGYKALVQKVLEKVAKETIKGIYGDGDLGLIPAIKEYLPNIPFQLCVVHTELRMGMLVPVKSVHISKRLDAQKKHAIIHFQQLFRNCIYAKTKEEAKKNLVQLTTYAQESPYEIFRKGYRSLAYNFDLTLTHCDNPQMERDNNLLECFNGILKPRLTLMKGFKKKENISRYLKLFLLEFRFRPLQESRFKERRNQAPLQLGDVYLPPYYNFITLLRNTFNLKFF